MRPSGTLTGPSKWCHYRQFPGRPVLLSDTSGCQCPCRGALGAVLVSEVQVFLTHFGKQSWGDFQKCITVRGVSSLSPSSSSVAV